MASQLVALTMDCIMNYNLGHHQAWFRYKDGSGLSKIPLCFNSMKSSELAMLELMKSNVLA